jgi:large-conductance mechanosensitive channel
MAFDPQGVFKSQAFSVAGGVVIGMGLFWLVYTAIESLVRPLFNIVLDHGMIVVNRHNDIHWNCGAFLSAIIIAVICLALGFVMVRGAGK